jgi:hypothetical protein
VLLREPLEDLRNLLVIGGERRRAVVGEHRQLILRQQPLAHEAQQGGHGFRRLDQLAAAEDDEEDPVGLRLERDGLLLQLQPFTRRRRRLRLERLK